mgnify:CR=1 FL=1
MAIYRKIDCRISNDKKFRELSVEGKLAWYTILSRRDLAPIGAFKASFESLAIEQRGNEYLNKGFEKAFGEAFLEALYELSSKGLIKYDPEAFLIYVPNFLRFNFPENPNVVKSWNSVLDSLPECDLTNYALAKSTEIILNSQKDSFFKALPKEFVEAFEKGYSKGFPEDFGKGLAKQEQEQEQEQETYTHTEKSEEHPEVSENFAGRECEKPVSLKTEAIEEELPLEEPKEQVGSVSKKERVEPKPKKEVKTQSLQKPEELTDEFWQDFLSYRKQKKAPVTERVVSLLRKEAKTAGWKLEEVINEMMVRNWTGFKADWVKDDWKNPNAHWVTAAEYNKELPPVTYSVEARDKFIEKLHAGMNAFDIKDLQNHKEQK